jgi:lipoyl(octanoyl) transferase
MDYKKAFEIQLEKFAKRQKNEIDDTLLILEHPSVITLGTSADRANIIASPKKLSSKNIEVINTNRGGDVTFHNPGQIIGYLIIDLRNHEQDVKLLVWKIENFIIRMLLKEYGIKSSRIEGLRGVWVDNSKIAALGISIRRWITMHGFALNADNDLEGFNYIIPCGIKDKKVTSIKSITKKPIDKIKLKKNIAFYFTEEFGYFKK